MADITIFDGNGAVLENLSSADGTTIEDLFRVIGDGTLRKDGVLKANPRVLLTPGEYVFVPSKEPAPPHRHPGDSALAKFRNLLQQCNVMPSEAVIMVLVKQFASSVGLVDTPEQARDLYFEAALLPRSATRVVLGEKGISVADIFRGSDPSKAILLHAHENGAPRILKVATDKSIRHEWDVWSAVKASSSVSGNEASYLVSVQLIQFETPEIEVTRCGLLMRHYQGTLSQCKIPLKAEILLRYGKFLCKALSTLHHAGFCHLDVKPSNVFLFEDACYLGDYGAAVKTGDPIRERTTKYYPSDGDFEASEETDMYLLAVTLLEMFGTIPQASERSPLAKQEIREMIASVETDEVRTFLNSLFDGHPET